MEKIDKKPVRKIRVYTCQPSYLLETMVSPSNLNPSELSDLVVDFTLNPEIAKLCKKMGLNYVGCSADEKACIALKKKLGFPNGYCTGISY